MTGFDHDYKRFPELTNTEMAVLELTSPHPQIKTDFRATVVKVHDGDTVTLRADFRDFDFPLRFLDIDAPELNTGAPGQEARDYVKDLILGKEVEILVNPDNRVGKYGRLLGRIRYMGSIISDDEVRLGYAKPFTQRREGELPDLNKDLNIKQWL